MSPFGEAPDEFSAHISSDMLMVKSYLKKLRSAAMHALLNINILLYYFLRNLLSSLEEKLKLASP
jgi:hypothetical protein